MGDKLISFSLYGEDPMYIKGAVANVRLAEEHYPGWVCRFFLGDSVSDEAQAELESLGAQTVRMPNRLEDWSAMLWRYLTTRDWNVEAHVFRDADSRLNAREASAVAEWLASGKHFHIMRDHPEHNLPIMGGMWGVDRSGAAVVRGLLPDKFPSVPFVDQAWLARTVYPEARKSMCVHDESGRYAEYPRPFPVRRQEVAPGGWAFVGQGFDADGKPRVPLDAYRVSPEEVG